jgi:hypothetical protein
MTNNSDIATQLTTFFEGLRTGVYCIRDLRKNYDKKMAFDFNSLNFFQLGENKTSEIISFFLNPNAAHGQGDAFLKCFCSVLLPSGAFTLHLEDYSTAVVKVEEPTDENRRIDIVVRFPKKRLIIGIENKIWAKDQEEQLDHYVQYLHKESDGHYHLFYLTPFGHLPSQESIIKEKYDKLAEDEKLSLLSYESVNTGPKPLLFAEYPHNQIFS